MEMSTDGLSLVSINHSSNKSLENSHCVKRWLHLMVSYHSNHDTIITIVMLLLQQRDIMSYIQPVVRRIVRRKVKRKIKVQQLLHKLNRRRKQPQLMMKRNIKMLKMMMMMMICLNNQNLRIHMLTCQRGNVTNQITG